MCQLWRFNYLSGVDISLFLERKNVESLCSLGELGPLSFLLVLAFLVQPQSLPYLIE